MRYVLYTLSGVCLLVAVSEVFVGIFIGVGLAEGQSDGDTLYWLCKVSLHFLYAAIAAALGWFLFRKGRGQGKGNTSEGT